jgi:hypothetical protein
LLRFQALGHAYDIEVKKGRTRTSMGGARWRRFIAENGLIGWREILCFLWREPIWRISVIYGGGGEEDSLGTTIITQRCTLSEEDKDHLLDIVPLPRTFIGVPFI